MLDENDTTTTTDTASPGASGTSDPDGATPEDTAAAPVVKKTTRRAPRKTAKKAAPAAGPDAGPATEPPQPSMRESAERGAELTAEQLSGTEETAAPGDAPAKKTARKSAAKKAPAKKAAAKKATTRKTTSRSAAKKAAPEPADEALPLAGDTAEASAETARTSPQSGPETGPEAETSPGTATESVPGTGAGPVAAPPVLFKAPDPVAAPRRRRKSAAAPAVEQPADASAATTEDGQAVDPGAAGDISGDISGAISGDSADAADVQAPADADVVAETDEDTDAETVSDVEIDADADAAADEQAGEAGDEQEEQGGGRRRRRRGGRRRRRGGGDEDTDESADAADAVQAVPESGSPDADAPEADTKADDRTDGRADGRGSTRGKGQRGSRSDRSKAEEPDAEEQEEGTGSRRRRRRRRSGEEGDGGQDDPQNTVVRVRRPRNPEDEITSVHGSTRLEAKKQRRREGREAGRRRAPIVSEAEFLARREAVERVMVIRQRKDLTQIAVLEDKVLVEHYVARESQTSLIGNVYLGRVQNVLPSMEAAFIDIGKGRNAVLYAGEVNWDALGAGNGPRKIEQVLKSGQSILVQVSKDPIGHKGARLTSQVSLPGRFLVYVPDGTTSGISRKLPDTERSRLKTLLKEIVPDTAGVIVRTAAEGASEEELTLDVERLTARWSDIEARAQKGNAPQLLYGEPDLTLKVVRDLFTEDFAKLVVSGDDAWEMVDGYVKQVAPDLEERLERYTGDDDVFAAYRIDEQIAKGLDRKVWLPSGGSLVIDRTEAMTVVDVNTGKFTGSGGNLEETVTKNNLEAAEEIVRQLRLRDIGGIIVVDFIDMVLESNRDLVLRRLVECLGRDRTRHQVAEVTSLGLVQMTRKRIGTGLLEAFSESCEHCQGRGVLIHHEPVEPRKRLEEEPRRGRRGRNRSGDEESSGNGGGNGGTGGNGGNGTIRPAPSPKDIAAMAKHEPRPVDPQPVDEQPVDQQVTGATGNGAPAVPSVEEPVGNLDGGPVETPVESPVDKPDDGPVDTRDEGPADSPVDVPVEPEVLAAAAEAETRSEPTEGEQPVQEPSVPTEPAAPVVPAGPRVVTSTRRRVVRRPAGPPAGPPAGAPAPDVTGAEVSGNGVSPQTGSPAAAEDPGHGPAEGQDTHSEQVHVPVKRRGRKR